VGILEEVVDMEDMGDMEMSQMKRGSHRIIGDTTGKMEIFCEKEYDSERWVLCN